MNRISRLRASRSGAHVLIVDDDVDGREAVMRLLRYAGYVVTTASDGHEALAVLRGAERRPDLILLDIMMPGMDGKGFRESQKQDPELRDIPILVVSAQGELNQIIDANGYLDKPLEFDTLVDQVERLVNPTGSGSGGDLGADSSRIAAKSA